MINVTDLPTVNAVLNSIAAILLTAGYLSIRRGHIELHRRCMLAAFVTSTVFLVSYLIYHAQVGSQPFSGEGPIRVLYFTVLISHITVSYTHLTLPTILLV